MAVMQINITIASWRVALHKLYVAKYILPIATHIVDYISPHEQTKLKSALPKAIWSIQCKCMYVVIIQVNWLS